MTDEQDIQDQLTKKFSFLDNNIRVPRPRRIFVEVPYEKFEEVFVFAIKDLGFSILCSITGLDEGHSLSFIYHVARENKIVLNIKTSVSKDKPSIKTITKYFPGADIYEREMMDLLGAEIEGLGAGKRYPLPDDWPAGEYPLRKDWKKSAAKKSEEGIKNA